MRLFHVFASVRSRTCLLRRIGKTKRKNANAHSASSRYTNGNPTYATNNPLMAGPTTHPIRKTLLFQVTALANASRGTSVAKNELHADQLNVRGIAQTKRSREINAIEAPSKWN